MSCVSWYQILWLNSSVWVLRVVSDWDLSSCYIQTCTLIMKWYRLAFPVFRLNSCVIYIVFTTLIFKGRTAGRFSVFGKKNLETKVSSRISVFARKCSSVSDLSDSCSSASIQTCCCSYAFAVSGNKQNHVECSERGSNYFLFCSFDVDLPYSHKTAAHKDHRSSVRYLKGINAAP